MTTAQACVVSNILLRKYSQYYLNVEFSVMQQRKKKAPPPRVTFTQKFGSKQHKT